MLKALSAVQTGVLARLLTTLVGHGFAAGYVTPNGLPADRPCTVVAPFGTEVVLVNVPHSIKAMDASPSSLGFGTSPNILFVFVPKDREVRIKRDGERLALGSPNIRQVPRRRSQWPEMIFAPYPVKAINFRWHPGSCAQNSITLNLCGGVRVSITPSSSSPAFIVVAYPEKLGDPRVIYPNDQNTYNYKDGILRKVN